MQDIFIRNKSVNPLCKGRVLINMGLFSTVLHGNDCAQVKFLDDYAMNTYRVGDNVKETGVCDGIYWGWGDEARNCD